MKKSAKVRQRIGGVARDECGTRNRNIVTHGDLLPGVSDGFLTVFEPFIRSRPGLARAGEPLSGACDCGRQASAQIVEYVFKVRQDATVRRSKSGRHYSIEHVEIMCWSIFSVLY